MTTQASKPTTTLSTTPPALRSEYPLIVCVMSRWNDYDMLGHVNNVEYYRYFETAILTLLRETGLNWQTDPVIPLAAENHGSKNVVRLPLGIQKGRVSF